MQPIYKQLGVIAAVCALCHCAAAQTSPAKVYKVQFRTLSWDRVISDQNYPEGGQAVPISLLPNGRSPFYDYKGTDPLLFFREITGTDGKPVAEVSGSIPLSEFHARTLLLFFDKPGNAKQYNIASVDDSDAAIPPGGYCFFNLSPVPLQIVCSGNKGTVAGGRTLTLPGKPAGGGTVASLSVNAVAPDGTTRCAYSNRVPFGNTERTLVFVYQDPKDGSFIVKKIGEDASVLSTPTPRRR